MKKFSIGIPVYNEEENIAKLLNSIANQQLGDFELEKIIVYNDGSTDATANNINKLLESNEWLKQKTHFISAKQNNGKLFGLNNILEYYNANKLGDYLVLLDSDVLLVKPDSLQIILKPLRDEPKTGLTSGWYRFNKQKENLYKVFSFSGELLKEIGKSYPVYNAWGGIIAIKKELAERLKLPDIVPYKLDRDDAYLYFYAKKSGYDYKFMPEAEVIDSRNFAKLSFKQFVQIQKRVCDYSDFFYKEFSKKIVDEESNLSLSEKVKVFVKVFLKNPMGGFWYLVYKTAVNCKIPVFWNPLKKIINKAKEYYPAIIIMCIGFFVLNWFKGNFIVDTMDFTFPYDRLYFFKKLFSVWNDFNNLGYLDTRALPFLIPYGLYNLIIATLHIPLAWGQKIFIYAVFTGSGLSAYYFSRQLKLDKISSLAAAIFYMANPFSISAIWTIRDLFVISYAFTPLAIGHFIGVCESEKPIFKNAIIHCLLVFFVLTSAFSNPVMLLIYLGAIFLYALIFSMRQKNMRALKTFLAICAILSALSAFWLIPFFNASKNEFSNAEGKIQQTNDLFVLANSSESVLESFSLTGYWMLFSEYKGDYYYPWYARFQTQFGSLLKYLPLFLLLIYFAFGKNNSTKIYLAGFVFIGLFFLTGNKGLIPNLKMDLFKSMPFFLRAFRNLETKFYPVLLLGMAPAVGAGIGICSSRMKNCEANLKDIKKIFSSLFVILLALLYMSYLMLPVFNGEVIYPGGKVMPSFRVQVPEYYQDAKAWLNQQADDFKILPLPLPTTSFSAYKWPNGFAGTTPDNHIFGKSVLSYNSGENYIIPFTISKFQEQNKQNSEKMARVAGLANIKYILLHDDTNWEYINSNDYWIKTSPDFFKEMEKYSTVDKFGKLSFLKTPEENLNPLIYMPKNIYAYSGDFDRVLDIYGSDLFYKPSAVLLDKKDISNATSTIMTAAPIIPDANIEVVWGNKKDKNAAANSSDLIINAGRQIAEKNNLFVKNNNGQWIDLNADKNALVEILKNFSADYGISFIANGSFEKGLWREQAEDCSAGQAGSPKVSMSLERDSATQNSYLKLESKNHSACTYQEIFPYSPDKDYVLSLRFKNFSGNFPEACVYEDKPGQCLFYEKIIPENSVQEKDGWYEWTKIFHTGTTTTKSFVYLYTPSQDMDSVNLFDDVSVKKLPVNLDNIIFSYQTNTQKIEADKTEAATNATALEFTKFNPTLYLVSMENMFKNNFIVFNESFHDGWKIHIVPQGSLNHWWNGLARFFGLATRYEIPAKNHISANEYANAWYLDLEKICALDNNNGRFCFTNSDGSYDLEAVIEFMPQRLFYLGSIISILALLASLRYLQYEYKKEKRLKSVK